MTISSAHFYARITLNRLCQTSGDLLSLGSCGGRRGPRRRTVSGGWSRSPEVGAGPWDHGRKMCVARDRVRELIRLLEGGAPPLCWLFSVSVR